MKTVEKEINMKIFISGPMTGYENFNKDAFNQAERYLKSLGFSVFNPAWLSFDEEWTHEEIMVVDLAALAQCDGIYFLKGRSKSIGSKIELEYALSNCKKIFFEESRQEIVDMAVRLKNSIKINGGN